MHAPPRETEQPETPGEPAPAMGRQAEPVNPPARLAEVYLANEMREDER